MSVLLGLLVVVIIARIGLVVFGVLVLLEHSLAVIAEHVKVAQLGMVVASSFV